MARNLGDPAIAVNGIGQELSRCYLLRSNWENIPWYVRTKLVAMHNSDPRCCPDMVYGVLPPIFLGASVVKSVVGRHVKLNKAIRRSIAKLVIRSGRGWIDIATQLREMGQNSSSSFSSPLGLTFKTHSTKF